MKYLIRDCQPNDVLVLVDLCQKHANYERVSFNPTGKEEKLKKAIVASIASITITTISSTRVNACLFLFSIKFFHNDN